MMTFYIDESGYTGFDLLNKDQPFQGASSLRIDEERAKSLVDEYFPKRQGLELKHKKLSKRKSNWKSLLEIQRKILQNHIGFTYVCDKKYLLILKFLDTCVEPFFYDQGVNFYEDGQNYALASLLYYTAPTFWGEENFENFILLFQRAMKTKSDLSINVLVEKARSLSGKDLSENLLPLAMEYYDCIQEIKNLQTNTDAAYIVLLSLISHIEKYVNCEYTIVHDTSKNLLKYNEIINKFINVDDNASFKQTTETRLSFPLRLAAVMQENSKTSYGVQLADILIGGIVEYGMAMAGLVKKTDYNQAVIVLYNESNFLHLFPSLDFENTKQFRTGTEAFEAIDFITKNISNK